LSDSKVHEMHKVIGSIVQKSPVITPSQV